MPQHTPYDKTAFAASEYPRIRYSDQEKLEISEAMTKREGYLRAKAEDAGLLAAARMTLAAIEPMCTPTAGIALHAQRDALRAALKLAEGEIP